MPLSIHEAQRPSDALLRPTLQCCQQALRRDRYLRRPHAGGVKIALATAAAPGMIGGSPTPRAPSGPSGDATSTITGVMGGICSALGMV